MRSLLLSFILVISSTAIAADLGDIPQILDLERDGINDYTNKLAPLKFFSLDGRSVPEHDIMLLSEYIEKAQRQSSQADLGRRGLLLLSYDLKKIIEIVDREVTAANKLIGELGADATEDDIDSVRAKVRKHFRIADKAVRQQVASYIQHWDNANATGSRIENYNRSIALSFEEFIESNFSTERIMLGFILNDEMPMEEAVETWAGFNNLRFTQAEEVKMMIEAAPEFYFGQTYSWDEKNTHSLRIVSGLSEYLEMLKSRVRVSVESGDAKHEFVANEIRQVYRDLHQHFSGGCNEAIAGS